MRKEKENINGSLALNLTATPERSTSKSQNSQKKNDIRASKYRTVNFIDRTIVKVSFLSDVILDWLVIKKISVTNLHLTSNLEGKF